MTTFTQTLAWCTSYAELAHSAHSCTLVDVISHFMAQDLSLVISHPRSYPWAHLLDSSLPFYFYLFFLVFSFHLLHSELYPELDNPIVMESLCYSANKGSDDAFDVSPSLTETVMPVDWLTNHPSTESDGSRANDFYTTADGSKVHNEGQRKLDVCTLDGQQRRSMTFQVARVKKALGSVSQMVKNGSKLVFDQKNSGKDTSYIQNKRTNEKIWLRQENSCVRLGLDGSTPAKRQ